MMILALPALALFVVLDAWFGSRATPGLPREPKINSRGGQA